MTRGSTSFQVMSIWNVRCKLWHMASLHFTWCQFGMSVASYDTWRHFISRDVNLECQLQVMTSGATSFHVMSIWNVRCKLRHVAPLIATWDSALNALKIYSSVLVVGPSEDPERSHYGKSGWNPEEEWFGSQSVRGVVQTNCPATPTAKRWVS
jgi:hypothetical protein